MTRNGNARKFCVSYSTVAVVYFTEQKWNLKNLYRIGCVMVCKIGLINWIAKIALLLASMVVTYYIKLFRTRADRHSGILMSLLLLVAETKSIEQCRIRSIFDLIRGKVKVERKIKEKILKQNSSLKEWNKPSTRNKKQKWQPQHYSSGNKKTVIYRSSSPEVFSCKFAAYFQNTFS